MTRSLEVHELPATARRIRIAQRIGVGLLVLLFLAGLAGLFGLGGPAADARTVRSGTETTVPRFARYLSPTRIEVTVDRAAADTVVLTLRGGHARNFNVQTILPRPDQVATTGDATVYRFAAVAGQPHRIRLSGQMESIGPVSGSLRVDDGPALPIDTFVYP